MNSGLLPDAYAPDVFAIQYKKLWKMGYRALIFDIDNTLVPHGADSEPRVDRLFAHLHEIGFETLLLTNNDEARTRRFMQNITAEYICDAEKPAPDGFRRAVDLLHCDAKEIVCIGDQMFVDTLGANRAGLDNILVHFIRRPDETRIGKKRYIEFAVLRIWKMLPQKYHRLECAVRPDGRQPERTAKQESLLKRILKFRRGEMLFCDISPLCYRISEQKEICKRHLKNLRSHTKYAKRISAKTLPNTVSTHSCGLIKQGKGIDPVLQQNKAENIALAAKHLDGLLIRPGETFSFWHSIGNTTRRRGYKDGRIIANGRLMPGVGGGLCNLSNTLHLLVLHSPLTVTEVHYHSDALAPDHGVRVPMSAGTSVSYNYIDFRFRNDTDQPFQLTVRVQNGQMHAALRSLRPIPYTYAITEEDHHFAKEGDAYYRISKIYRETTDPQSGIVVEKKLIRDNHSEVMFDLSELDPALVRES